MKINTDNELAALTEHIEKHWDGFDKHNINDVMATIWNHTLPLTKYATETHDMIGIIEKWQKERNDYNNWIKAGTSMSESEFINLKPLDAVNKSIMWLIIGPMDIQSAFSDKWDYEKVCKNIIEELKAEFPGIAKIKPKGWLKLSRDYESYDGMDEYLANQKAIDVKEFKGINSGTASSHSFTTRVALPYVMYNDKDQGVKALETLVGSIVAHAYAVACQNNNLDLLNDVQALKDKYNSLEHYQEILLSMDLKNTLTSPIGRALNVIMEAKITWTTEGELKEAKGELTNEAVVEEQPLKLGSKEGKKRMAALIAKVDSSSSQKTKEDKNKEKEEEISLLDKAFAAFDSEPVNKKLKM